MLAVVNLWYYTTITRAYLQKLDADKAAHAALDVRPACIASLRLAIHTAKDQHLPAGLT